MRAIAMHGAPLHEDGFAHFDYVNPKAPKGGALRLNLVGSFDSLNPFIVKGRAAEGLSFVHERLMARGQNEPFTLYPLLAERIEIRPDRSAIRFHVNPRARWQDGRPVTADDVLFSFESLRARGRPNHRTYYNKVAKAEKTGPLAVTFHFRRANGVIDREMPLIMGLMPILPKHVWQDRAFDETTLDLPLGSGPYRVAEVEPGRSIVYARDKNYWGRDLPSRKGMFNFDTVRFDYYRDESVAMEAFTARQVDARREGDPRRWQELKRLAGKRGFRIRAFPHKRPEPVRAFIFNTRRGIFSDPKVREALNYAFDFDWMNRTLFRGEYRRIESIFPNSELAAAGPPSEKEMALLKKWIRILPQRLLDQPFHLPRAKGRGAGAMRANLLHAARLLKQAGYGVKDGALTGPGGKDFVFEILLSRAQDEKIALEYARSLKKLGITAHVRTVDSAQFQARLNDFDYDMVLFRWINSLSPGNEQTQYWGREAARIKGSRNYAGIENRIVDGLVQKLVSAKTRADLVAAARALDRVLMWNFYMVPLAYRGTDPFVLWPDIAYPSTIPLYGMGMDTWYSEARSQKSEVRKN